MRQSTKLITFLFKSIKQFPPTDNFISIILCDTTFCDVSIIFIQVFTISIKIRFETLKQGS